MSSAGGRRATTGGEIVTIQCGAAANWIGTQYHLLQVSAACAQTVSVRSRENLPAARTLSANLRMLTLLSSAPVELELRRQLRLRPFESLPSQ